MMDLPVFFADLFARRIRHKAEARGVIFAAIYSTGTASCWDFPRDSREALARMRDHTRNGDQVVVFKRDPDGVWRIWANANLPVRMENAA